MKNKYYEGSEWKNKKGGVAKIICGTFKKDYYVVIINNNKDNILPLHKTTLRNGEFKDRLYPSVQNVGYIGIGEYSTNSHKAIYGKWGDMLSRCYGRARKTHPAYSDVTVCKEWFNFQNFAQWVVDNNFTNEQIDKDLLFKDNKLYSPSTCCLIPSKLNSILANIKNVKGYAYLKRENKWRSKISINGKDNYLGYFKTEIEARECYLHQRKIENQKILDEWESKLTPRLFSALQDRLAEMIES